MRKDSLCRYFAAFLIAFAVSAGGSLSILTAFAVPADTGVLICACIFMSALFPAALLRRHWGRWMLLLLLAGAFLVWRRYAELLGGLLLTAEHVMQAFAEGFSQLRFLDGVSLPVPADAQATDIAVLLGALMSFTGAWTVVGGYGLLSLGILSGMSMVICLLTVFTVPAFPAFLAVMLAWLLLIMSRGQFAENSLAGSRLVLRLALPVSALLMLLYFAAGPKNFLRPAEVDILQQDILSRAEREDDDTQKKPTQSSGKKTLGASGWNEDTEKTKLSTVGPQRKTGMPAMTVTASRDGVLYLRGNSYSYYDGVSWSAEPSLPYEGASLEGLLCPGSLSFMQRVGIETRSACGIYYLPYYPLLPDEAVPLYDAYAANPRYEKEYEVFFSEAFLTAPPADYPAYMEFVNSRYLQIEEETAQRLDKFAAEIYGGSALLSAREKALRVKEYLADKAYYDLSTERMPAGEDFACWFLEESDSGYCVHFATAATLLLRRMNVPARYVCGYMLTARADRAVTVTEDDAHAWVEYFIPGEGWMVLEATPSAENAAPTPGRTPESPKPTPETEGGSTRKEGGKGFWWLLLIPAVLAVTAAWRYIIRALRRRAFYSGTENERCLAACRHVLRFGRFMKAETPKFITETAEKARFSRCGVTAEELQRVLDYIGLLHAAARENGNILRRLAAVIVFGI